LRPGGGQVDAEPARLSRPLPTRYHKICHDAAMIETLLVNLFVEAHRRPPKQIILDLDATDDRCTAIRKAASSTATTIAIATCPVGVSAAASPWESPATGSRCLRHTSGR
jgi:hypothetical protein